jgi:outer membrane lipoprotein-sorting protein
MRCSSPMIAKARRLCSAVATALCVALALPAPAEQPPSAQDIVRRADEARFPQEGFEVLVAIRTLQGERVREERLFKVLSKGNENTVVMTLEPASERGQILLMKGNDLWMFLPRVSQPVRLSLAQRLVGQVSNGDIARANFAGDYNAKLVGTERIGNDTLYVLELAAASRSVTYQRVRYWVRQADFRPYRAEFYSLSDRLLKTCEYRDYKALGGKVRPTRLVMVDALNKGEYSTLDYSAMKLREVPDHIFSKEYLRRLD